MFCDQCGTPSVAGQLYCSRCGKKFSGQVLYMPQSRVQEHIRLLSILWMALSALNGLGGLILIVLANTLFAHPGWISSAGRNLPPNVHIGFLQPLLTVVGIFVLVKGAAGFLAGWGLLQKQSWARILTLVLGFISLFNIPFGTALGIYTLWVLLPSESEKEYTRMSQGTAA